MKKFIALICAAIFGIGAANADPGESGTFAAGVNLNYGSLTKSFGFGIRGQYTFPKHFRGELTVNYFTKHDYKKAWDINLNAHYMVNLWQNRLYLYPLAGLNYTMMNEDAHDGHDKDEKNHMGLNLGIGAQFAITDHISALIEYRHTIERKIDQGVFTIGATYNF